ncbi:MAG: replicative DNA helicase [Eubacterium sp.]|nr:replicative DNA helicase [Eubacterium sp.]
MAERIPPHSKEAEQACLGAAMLDKDALADVLDIVTAEDFYESGHREIFKAIRKLFDENKEVDIVTVSDKLKQMGSLELAGGRAYVGWLPSEAPSVINAAGYAKIVSEKASLRSLIRTADEIREQSFDEGVEVSTILDNAEREIFDVAQGRERKNYVPINDVLLRNIDSIDRAIKAGGRIKGVPTGYAEIDKITNGLQKSDLVILAARPGMGKSAFALNIALNAAKKADAKVLIFNLEMSDESLGMRMLSIESNVEISRLRDGNVERHDWDKIHMAMDRLSKMSINIDDTPGARLTEMKSKCRRMKAQQGLDLIIVDYLQLMDVEGENRNVQIGKITRALKLLAREMDCPLLALSQLSRPPKDQKIRRPILSDLRDSGSIEQDADMVIFLHRDEYYTKEESTKPGICEVDIAKHRNGETKMVELTWVGRYTKFADRAFASEESAMASVPADF